MELTHIFSLLRFLFNFHLFMFCLHILFVLMRIIWVFKHIWTAVLKGNTHRENMMCIEISIGHTLPVSWCQHTLTLQKSSNILTFAPYVCTWPNLECYFYSYGVSGVHQESNGVCQMLWHYTWCVLHFRRQQKDSGIKHICQHCIQVQFKLCLPAHYTKSEK